MKCYGRKDGSKTCQCKMCGKLRKDSSRKGSERNKAKREISQYRILAKPSRPSFSKAMIEKMMKKKA